MCCSSSRCIASKAARSTTSTGSSAPPSCSLRDLPTRLHGDRGETHDGARCLVEPLPEDLEAGRRVPREQIHVVLEGTDPQEVAPSRDREALEIALHVHRLA